MSAVKFTTSEEIEAFRRGEYVPITGYIIMITRATVKDNKRLIKFALSNGTGKMVMCIVWNNKVPKIAEVLRVGRVNRMEEAFCTASEVANWEDSSFNWMIEDDTQVDVSPNLGNVPFYLTIEDRTTVYIEL